MSNKELILGIDGGGTKTSAILFDSRGNTIDSIDCLGSNLYVYGEEGIKRIIDLKEDGYPVLFSKKNLE